MIDRQIIELILRAAPELSEKRLLNPCRKRYHCEQRQMFTYLVRDIWKKQIRFDDIAFYFHLSRATVCHHLKVYGGMIEYNRTERARYEAMKTKVIAEMLKTGLMA